MVRGRRGRAAKTGDEVCYASPKRKDSRLENIGNLANGVDVAQQTNGELPKIPSPPTTRSKNGAYGKADKNVLHNGKIVKNTHITNYFHVVSPTNGFDEARISKIPINIKQENGNLQPLFNGTRIEDRDYSEQNGFHTFGMDRYMGFDEISKIIHTVRSESDRKKDILSNIFKREISEMTNVDEARGYDRLGECEIIEENYNPVVMMNGFCPPKLENGFKSNGSSGSFEDVSDIVSESNNEDNNVLPNVRLSPRKHASTMQRCVTVKENVKTPHRIRLCEAVPQLPSHSLQQLSIKPYRKRTRRRLAVKSQDDTSSSDSSLTPSVNLGDNLTVTTKLPCQIIRDEKILSNDCALTNTTCLKAYQNQAVHKHDHTDHTVHIDHKPDHTDRTVHTDHIPDSLVVPDLAKVLKKEEVKIEGKANGIIANGVVGSHKLTDYFPVRRSVRKTKKEVLEEKQRDLEVAIREEREEGLEVANFEGKGRGVITARNFQRGEFVVEYCGELVSMSEARTREAGYAQDSNKGCYMYYFRHNNHQYCIDATAESGRLGRLVNHSRNGNLLTKAVHLDGRPHLVLLAGQDIAAGEEVTYDYGDRSREALQHHPWLAL